MASKPKDTDFKWLVQHILGHIKNRNMAESLLYPPIRPEPPPSEYAYTQKLQIVGTWRGPIPLSELIEAVPPDAKIGDLSISSSSGHYRLNRVVLVPSTSYESMLKRHQRDLEKFARAEAELEENRLKLIESINDTRQNLAKIQTVLPHLTPLKWSSFTSGASHTVWANFCAELLVIFRYDGRHPPDFQPRHSGYTQMLKELLEQQPNLFD